MDSTRLDSLYQDCAVSLSASYRKVILLFDAGKTADAAKEFKTSFVPEVKKFYSESAETAHQRYLKDGNWNAEIKDLYLQTQKTADFLDKGNVKTSRTGLESLREFFYKLHTDNKINFASDAIYAFKKQLDRVSLNGSLTKGEIAALGSLKSGVLSAAPSVRIKAEKAQFDAKAKAWSEEVNKILSLPAADTKQVKKLKEITDGFYIAYGMDFE